MRITLVASAFTASLVLAAAESTAQGPRNPCAPPSYSAPDGPRPSGPDTGTSTSTGDSGRSTNTGDSGRPTGRPDPSTGTRTGRGARTGGGIAVPLTRGTSAKKRLQIQWSYPKGKGEKHLDYESALAEVRGMDPRPLLVLREGSQYGVGYDKMLAEKLDNDKTTLLTRWFHCVRFPTTVMEEAHPLNALFSGKYPPHCYVTTWDGHHSIPLSGVHPLSFIQRSMVDILKREYRKDPEDAIRGWMRVLDDLDTLDSQEEQLRKQMDDIEFKHGPDARQLRPLKIRLEKLTKQREAAKAREKEVTELNLIRKLADTDSSKLLDRIRSK